MTHNPRAGAGVREKGGEMRSTRVRVLIAVIGLLSAAPCRVGSEPAGSGRPTPTASPFHPDLWFLREQQALFGEALDLAGLTFDTFRLEPEVVSLWGGDRYRLPLFDLFYRDVWSISPYTRDLAKGLITGAGSISGITASAQAATGIRVRDNFYSSFLTGIVEEVDAAGNDRYTGDSGVEGSGTFGIGVLADLSGDDLYHCFCKSQGYGYTRGCGVLVDVAGSDRYIAETGNVKYRWFGTHPKQLNLSQGFGYGRRADMGDGHSWAGGVGILADGGGGNDIYEADVFAIGSAYWYALGILYDAGGDDRYRSYAYSIAAPPHFAVGVVLDESGDDTYFGHSSRACGFGRDFSIGWFEEEGGNDLYYGNDSAFGAGNINSLGVCWDKAGDDLYVARSNSFGRPFMESSGNRRDLIRNAGLFVDGGGKDLYRQLPAGMTDAEHEAFDWTRAADLPLMEDLRDGARVSWRDLIIQPGSTGAAVDAE